jgi:DNA-binding response OmpR family regulator
MFMDQYMASTEKQLLGTETTRELRAKEVTCKICGLSANDVEKAFMSAGADAFMSKPIPFHKEELERELRRVLYGAQEEKSRSCNTYNVQQGNDAASIQPMEAAIVNKKEGKSPKQPQSVQNKGQEEKKQVEEWQVDAKTGGGTTERDLPEQLSVLFVDDDKILRKLFARSINRVLPGWKVQEAASGETAIQKADSESFDLIFYGSVHG